jgi:phosphoenolpyruvate carboxykinase (ATP)
VPGVRHAPSGALSIRTNARGWSRPSTFVVGDEARYQAISPAEAQRLADVQESHLANTDVLRLEGTIGAHAGCRVGAALWVDSAHAHVAAVCDRLFHGPASDDGPRATVVCTPGLRVDGYPDGRVIAVDFQERVTRILGTDFPGEVKRAGLRVWAKQAWDAGGLALHAAVKAGSGPPGRRQVVVIAGRPGTGKTSLAFAAGEVLTACQEERVALMADGSLVAAENAFFTPVEVDADEPRPLVDRALADPRSVLLNVGCAQDGQSAPVARVVFEPGAVGAPVLADGERPSALVLLVRNQNILPAVAKLDRRTAVALFTAPQGAQRDTHRAAGSRETLGGSPLFPLEPGAEGRRLDELLARHEIDVYVLNTWRVGGPPGVPSSRKLRLADTAALIDAIATGAIDWAGEDALGVVTARSVAGVDIPQEALHPVELYERQGRRDEYDVYVERLRSRWHAAVAALEEVG